MRRQLLTLDPATYRPHDLHGDGRSWTETNCYVDLWIELLHAWGFDPHAALPFTLGIDCEGDQWTFFKFPLADLDALYGLDVQELALWRPVVEHVAEQVGRGRPVLVELDSYFLPDTAGTAYRREHVKTTVAVNAIDLDERRLGYFHNRGYYHLDGADFASVFRLGEPGGSAHLPPYAEFVKRRARLPLSDSALTQTSVELLRRHLRQLPEANPFAAFATRFAADVGTLADAGMAAFHAYAFATLRQFGASFELAATYLHWLQRRTDLPLAKASADLESIATGAKALQFRLARVVATRKPLDLAAVAALADAWHRAMTHLRETCAGA